MASAESPESVIQRFAALLEASGIPYMLTGSFASGFHGAPRATQDIDIVISPNLSSLNRFLRLLPDDQYYVSQDAALEAYSRETLFNVVDFSSGWKVDMICRKARAFSVTEFDRRIRQELAGVSVFVATAEDVLLAKLEWAKLAQSARQLEDAVGIVRIQRDNLDTNYIGDWAERLGISEQWEEVQTRAAQL